MEKMSQRQVKWPPKHTASQGWKGDQTPGLLATKSHATLMHSTSMLVQLRLNLSVGYPHFWTSQLFQETQFLKDDSGLCSQELITCPIQSVIWQSVCKGYFSDSLEWPGIHMLEKRWGASISITSNFVSIEEKLVWYNILPWKSIDIQQRTILNNIQ